MYEPIFKENHRGPLFLKRVFDFMNQSGRFMNNIRGLGGCEVTPNEFGGLDIRASAGGGKALPLVFHAWNTYEDGTALPANQLRIATGYMEGRYGYLPVNGAVVTCGGAPNDKHLIIAQGTQYGGDVVPNTVSAASFSGDTATVWRRVLYRVYIEAGSVRIDAVCAGAWGIVL